MLFWVSYMHVFCIFVFAFVQRNWARFTWKGALEICVLLLLLLLLLNIYTLFLIVLCSTISSPLLTLESPLLIIIMIIITKHLHTLSDCFVLYDLITTVNLGISSAVHFCSWMAVKKLWQVLDLSLPIMLISESSRACRAYNRLQHSNCPWEKSSYLTMKSTAWCFSLWTLGFSTKRLLKINLGLLKEVVFSALFALAYVMVVVYLFYQTNVIRSSAPTEWQ